MVERLHRLLKTAIKCHKNNNWITELPLILLSIRTALKDFNATTAEIIIGSNLRLPGEFFNNGPQKETNSDFVNRLRDHIKNRKAVPGTNHGTNEAFILKDFYASSYVIIRNDVLKGTIKPT